MWGIDAIEAATRLGGNWYDHYGCTDEGLTRAVRDDIYTVCQSVLSWHPQLQRLLAAATPAGPPPAADDVTADWLTGLGLEYSDLRGGFWRLEGHLGLSLTSRGVQLIYFGGRGGLLRMARLAPGREAVLAVCNGLGVPVAALALGAAGPGGPT